MEPHSEKKGRLGGKFEDFSHPPKDDVWARIEADVPPKRRLGAIFSAFTWQPNPRVWRGIAAELHGKGGRRIAAAWWWSAAASVALVVGLSYFGLKNGSSSPKEGRQLARQTQTLSKEKMNAKRLAAQLQDQIDREAKAATGTHETNRQNNGSSSFQSDKHFAVYPNKHQGKDGPQPITHPKEIKKQHAPNELLAVNPLKTSRVNAVYDQADNWQRLLDAGREMKFEDEYRGMLAALNNYGYTETEDQNAFKGEYEARLGGSLANGGTGPYKSAGESFFTYDSGPNTLSAGVNDMAASPGLKNEDYSTPIVIGGFVNKKVHKRIDLGLGLVYTRMNSTSDYFSLSQDRTEKITRQYLGLASNAYYSFLQKKRIDLYLTAGTQFDVGLGKSTEIRTNIGSASSSTQTYKESAGNQLSFNLGTGLNYMLTKHIGAFGQGSLATYPWQSKGNLYSTKRFWPMGIVGLRLKL